MDWHNVNEEARKRGIGTGSSLFFDLEEGENKVHLASDFEVLATHFRGKGVPAVTCYGLDKGCPVCKEGERVEKSSGASPEDTYKYRPTAKFVCVVIDRNAQKENKKFVKIAQFPYSVAKKVGELAKSEEYGFPAGKLPPYDLVITKTKKGDRPQDVEYGVMASRKDSPLTAEEKKAVEDAEINVPDFIEKKKAKQMKADQSGPTADVTDASAGRPDPEEEIDVDDIPF